MPTELSPEERSLRARLAAHTSWANTLDPKSRTARARAAANGRFEKQAREKHPDATDEQIARVAEHLRKAHYSAMALKSAAARRAKARKPAIA
ncbi:hypothetical protein [Streptomyces sp. AVP053U2]|uniref:hypothetical protein n=1 Tax=Streptomyces sp. AVP053U2 TaxID=1737066 RepID=UPI00073C7707|nr:hypothetical protein [Streptomyces sp. AVP053U2]ODA69242.1 hypothetical protein APS67_006588 [Streptomyces sp. AVP053U2]